MVMWLRGEKSALVDSCDCTPDYAYPFYAAGDVNGSGKPDILDILYFVMYLRGDPRTTELLYPEVCVPAGVLLTVSTGDRPYDPRSVR